MLLFLALLGICGFLLLTMASLHLGWSLSLTRLLWVLCSLGCIAGIPLVVWKSKLDFGQWVRMQEAQHKIPELWSCAVQTPEHNPFFATLDSMATAALHKHRQSLHRPFKLYCFGVLASLILLLASIPALHYCFLQTKVMVALGLFSDDIYVIALQEIPKGEDWKVTVVTMHPKPFSLEIAGATTVTLPFTDNSLLLTQWKEDLHYRVHTPWGTSAWKDLKTYTPVTWKELKVSVKYPDYLELESRTFDLLEKPVTVVEKSILVMASTPKIEWSSTGHKNEWLAIKEEVRLRPTDGKHRGLWMELPITVVPDLPPKVTLLRPSQDVVWGDAKTNMEWEASDDFGLRKSTLHFRLLGEKDGVDVQIWEGKAKDKRLTYSLTTADIPHKAGKVYELTVLAMDGAGQWGTSIPRYLEIKDNVMEEGMDGKPQENLNLRATIVALLDILRDWEQANRPEKLKRLQIELEALATTAKQPQLQKALVNWSSRLSVKASKFDVETVVREMVVLQQKAEKTKPKPQEEGTPSELPEETVSKKDIERIQALQQAAMDGKISNSVRADLQKQVSERFNSAKPALDRQLPHSKDLLDSLTQTQKKLELSWSKDNAKLNLQQLEQLKSEMDNLSKITEETKGLMKDELLDQAKLAVNSDKGIPQELLNAMDKLATEDSKTDWSKIQAAAQKWNRAEKTGLPQLKAKAKDGFLSVISEAEATPQENSVPLQGALNKAVAKAIQNNDWQAAKGLAKKAGWSPELQKQLTEAESAPLNLRLPLLQGMFDLVMQQFESKLLKFRKDELQKTMPIDPKWEPTVDQYFELLNQRKN